MGGVGYLEPCLSCCHVISHGAAGTPLYMCSLFFIKVHSKLIVEQWGEWHAMGHFSCTNDFSLNLFEDAECIIERASLREMADVRLFRHAKMKCLQNSTTVVYFICQHPFRTSEKILRGTPPIHNPPPHPLIILGLTTPHTQRF